MRISWAFLAVHKATISLGKDVGRISHLWRECALLQGRVRVEGVKDVGESRRVKRGEYPLTDQTYAKLLQRLTSKPDRTIPIDVQQNIFRYYRASKTALDLEPRVKAQLDVLKGMKTADGLRAEPEPEDEPAPEN